MCCRAINPGLRDIFRCFWIRKEHISHSLNVLADTSEREFIAVNHLVAVLHVCDTTQRATQKLFRQSGGEKALCGLMATRCLRVARLPYKLNITGFIPLTWLHE